MYPYIIPGNVALFEFLYSARIYTKFWSCLILPRKVAEGKCSMAKRTLLTMPGSQQPVLLMEVDMTRSWATGLMHSLPLLMRSATSEIGSVNELRVRR